MRLYVVTEELFWLCVHNKLESSCKWSWMVFNQAPPYSLHSHEHPASWTVVVIVVVTWLSMQPVSNKLHCYCIELILIPETRVTVHYGDLANSWWCMCDYSRSGKQFMWQPDMMNRFRLTFPLKLTPSMPPVLCRELQSPGWAGCVFETNVQQDNGGNCEKCFQSLHIVLSHHLKSCQYPQRSIDPLSLLEGPVLYSILIDYVDSLCGVWVSCLCHDIRPWQQSHLFMWHDLLLWISKQAPG